MAVLEFVRLTNPGIEGHTKRKSSLCSLLLLVRAAGEILYYCSIWPGCSNLYLFITRAASNSASEVLVSSCIVSAIAIQEVRYANTESNAERLPTAIELS